MQNKIISTFSIKIAIALLNFLFTIVLSRLLGAQGKGEASIIVASLVVILIFCDIIGGASLIYFTPRYNNLKLFVVSNVWSGIVCAGVWVFFSVTSFIAPAQLWHIIGLAFISSLLSTNLSIILGKEKITTNNIISLLKTAIHFIIFLLLVYFFNNKSIYAYIYSFYISLIACTIISTLYTFKYIRNSTVQTNRNLIFELSKFGLYNQAGHIMKFLSIRLCFYLISYYSGSGQLGVYANGAALIEVILIISSSFTTTLYPRVANTFDKKYAQLITIHYNKISTLASLFAIIPMLLLPSSFYSWLFGPDFNEVKKVIVLQAPGIFFYNTALVIGHYFSGTGKNYINTIANFSGMLIVLIFSFLIIPNYTIFWASIICNCSYIVTTLIILFYFQKENEINLIQLIPGIDDLNYLFDKMKTMLKRLT